MVDTRPETDAVTAAVLALYDALQPDNPQYLIIRPRDQVVNALAQSTWIVNWVGDMAVITQAP